MVHSVDISTESGCINLEVKDSQKKYVCDSVTMLARAYLHRKFRPRVFNVYDDDSAVGKGMYLDSPEEESHDFCQLFIDKRYQHHGYGKASVQLVLDEMRHEGKYRKVTMCHVEGNDASRQLFEQFGIVEVSHPRDEIFMEMAL